MGGRASRDKGNRFERGIVTDLREAGLDARRVPLSGSMRGFKGDVQIYLAGQLLTLEAKSRASGFTFIYKAIENSDLLAIKVDRAEPLLIMRLKDAAAILGAKDSKQAFNATIKPSQVKSDNSLNAASIDQRNIENSDRAVGFVDLQSINRGLWGK